MRTHGGAMGRGGEYNARRRRPPVRSDGSDGGACELQVYSCTLVVHSRLGVLRLIKELSVFWDSGILGEPPRQSAGYRVHVPALVYDYTVINR